LCLWVEQRPAALRPLHATAEWVRARGGLCVAPHPFTRWTHSLSARALAGCLNAGSELLAGVEVLNASLAGRASRPRALTLAQAHAQAQLQSKERVRAEHPCAKIPAMTEAPGGSAGFGHGSDPEEHEALLRRIREFLRHGAAAEAGVEEWGEFAAQLRFLREELPPEERSALLERWDRVLL